MVPEIAIVGGGPSGLALAAILERKGLGNYIVYERGSEHVPPRGGCLDLHPGSGQRAMREAGVYEEFKRLSRDGPATLHLVYDSDGNQVTSWGEGRDAPEIDRFKLRQALLTAIPKEKVVWDRAVESAERDADGQVVLNFADGSTASGFKLVVGADGVNSGIRHLVHPVKPIFTRHVYLSGKINPTNPFYAKMQSMAKEGSMIVMGRRKNVFNQMQGDGHYRIDIGFEDDEDFTDKLVDFRDAQAVKNFLLQDDQFGNFIPDFREIIENAEGPFWPWFLYYFPPESLNWETAPGVALIGDAAHVTTPFVGDGANCALRDSVYLGLSLQKHGITTEAVTEYEKEMFPYAIDVITRSRKSESLFYAEDAPKGFVEVMKTGTLRRVFDPGYLDALHRDNVQLVQGKLSHVDEKGIVLQDGSRQDFDVIIFATGYSTQNFLAPMEIFGEGGKSLNDHWKETMGCQEYNSIAVSGFPNLAILLGPNGAPAHNSSIFNIEVQTEYVIKTYFETILSGRAKCIGVKRSAEDYDCNTVQLGLKNSVWTAGCTNWTINEDGRNCTSYPDYVRNYWWKLLSPNFGDYILKGGEKRWYLRYAQIKAGEYAEYSGLAFVTIASATACLAGGFHMLRSYPPVLFQDLLCGRW